MLTTLLIPHLGFYAIIILAFVVIVFVLVRTISVHDKYQDIQSKYALLFESAADAIFLYDMEGDIVDVNQTVILNYGYTREELLLMKVADINSDRFKAMVPDRLHLLKIQSTLFFETEHQYKNGKVIEVEVNARVIHYDGKMIVYNIVRDVTNRKQIERQVKDKDELLQMTNRIAKIGGWEFDPATFQGTWTDEVAYIHGHQPEEDHQIQFDINMYKQESRTLLENSVHEAISEHKSFDVELEINSADGLHKWVRSIGFPIVENDKVMKIKGIIFDITNNKAAEKELNDSRERLAAALEASNDGIWDVDMVTGEFYISPRGMEIFGFTPESKRSPQEWNELIHTDDYLRTTNAMEEHWKGNTAYFDIEYRFVTPLGEEKWLRTLGKVIERNETGEPKRITGTVSDITGRKLTEEALRESEEKYRTLIEVSNDAILINENNHFTYVNSAALRLLDATSPDQIIGLSPYQIFHPDYHELIRDRISLMLKEGTPCPISEEKVITLHQEIVDVEVAANPFKIRGHQAILVMMRDIRRRKAAEIEIKESQLALKTQNDEYIALYEELFESNERIKNINNELIQARDKAEESDRLKSAFLANMSHEIRTPMNAIIGFSQLLSKEGLNAKKRSKFTSLIQQRSLDLLRIVEDILDISKIEVGQLKIIYDHVFLDSLMRELQEYYHRKIGETERNDLELKLEFCDDLSHIMIRTDGQRLKQVLGNLLDNAFKFTHQGLITFGCSISQPDEILFFVKDTGIGISSEKLEVIFDRFRQADDLISTRQYGGSGLGLSIVKGIVQLLNGRIWVESVPGSGSVFYFTIPLERIISNEVPKGSSQEELPVLKKNKSILIVEDDPFNMEFLHEVLSETGIVLFCATNGEEAIHILKETPSVNLVLMDIRLPDINGMKLTRQLKKEYPHLVVIAQTAYASNKDIQDCAEAGCVDYISKPINTYKLLMLVTKYLN